MNESIKSKNGFYKYFNKDGKCARIKFTDCFKDAKVMIKFKKKDEFEWKYHSPDKIFKEQGDVIRFIMNNLENDCVFFEVHPSESVGKKY